MDAAENILLRDIRRVFDYACVDADRMEIQLRKGNVRLSGTIRSMRRHEDVILTDMMPEIERRLRRDQRIRSLVVECRLVQGNKHANLDEVDEDDNDEDDEDYSEYEMLFL